MSENRNMLTSRKPGPPVPPRPSAAAVANALAKHRENSPNQIGIHTLKPPHPGRTVVYKSPDFDHLKKPQSVVVNGNGSHNGSDHHANHTFKNGCDQSFGKTEVYVGEPNNGGYLVPRPVLPVANRNTCLENTKLIYTSTCSIIEINSSSSASTSASSSPMSTLQKAESKTNLNNSSSFSSGRSSANDSNHHNSADEEDISSHKLKLNNSFNKRPINGSERCSTIKLNSPEVIIINGNPSEHDSGTEHNSMDTNSIASNNSLERENNFKNAATPRKPHLTEIFIGSNDETVVSNGTKTLIEARNDVLLKTPIHLPYEPPKQPVIRSSSIRLPYRPEPEGGEHTSPTPIDPIPAKPQSKPPNPNPTTLKLSDQNKLDFHELLISELAQMRGKRQKPETEPESVMAPTRGSSPSGTAPRSSPRIRTADWIEVGDNGKEVMLSSCQISLEDSGLEDEGKHDEEDGDDLSSGVGDSWHSVKDDEERITMSLPGLPPLPKSLSGFDLAGQQLQSHQQHYYNLQQPPSSQQNQQHPPPDHSSHHQQHHHQPPTSSSSSLHPPHQPPPPPPSQPPPSQYNNHHPPSFNHHPTNPFIPINPANAAATVANLQSVSMASLVSQQRGQSPVSTVSSGNSIVATPNSGSNSGSGGSGSGSAAIRKATTLDTQLAVLRREMYGLRQLDLSLLSQLWALNESIQDFRKMLQEQDTLSPPSPSPSNSECNSLSSDEEEDDSSTTQTASVGGAGGGGVAGVGTGSGMMVVPSAAGHSNHLLESAVSAVSLLSSSQSSRMRAPPPPPPNRKAPSRPV